MHKSREQDKNSPQGLETRYQDRQGRLSPQGNNQKEMALELARLFTAVVTEYDKDPVHRQLLYDTPTIETSRLQLKIRTQLWRVEQAEQEIAELQKALAEEEKLLQQQQEVGARMTRQSQHHQQFSRQIEIEHGNVLDDYIQQKFLLALQLKYPVVPFGSIVPPPHGWCLVCEKIIEPAQDCRVTSCHHCFHRYCFEHMLALRNNTCISCGTGVTTDGSGIFDIDDPVLGQIGREIAFEDGLDQEYSQDDQLLAEFDLEGREDGDFSPPGNQEQSPQVQIQPQDLGEGNQVEGHANEPQHHTNASQQSGDTVSETNNSLLQPSLNTGVL